MNRIDSLARYFWDGFRCMSVRRPMQAQVRYYHLWRRAVALKHTPANPAWQRYVAADETIQREASKILSYIPSFKPDNNRELMRKRA